MKYIDVKDVSLTLNGQAILSHVSCSFDKGQITTIIGPNGGGKTSLVKLILGIYKPSSGRIVTKKHLKIGYMPQRFQVDPVLPMTVRRFLTHPADLAPLNAEYLIDYDMASLSGGEMQRVLLAYALQNNPDVLILDEPTGGLDVTGEQTLYAHVLDYQRQTGCCLIMVSHDLHFVMKQTDQVLCVNHHICCSGAPETVSAHSHYQALFGDQAPYVHHHDHTHERKQHA